MTTLSEEVYKRIRLSLFKNLYKPGDQLDIGQIATELKVSRQPVKEAISRLAQEGLVEIRQRVGSFVRKFNRADVKNILDVRRMIEVSAVSKGTADPHVLNQLEKAVDLMDQFSNKHTFDYVNYNHADQNFHKLLVSLSRNDILVNMYVQLNAHYISARAYYFNEFAYMLNNHGQHRQILNCLKQGDISQATSLIDYHIPRSESALLEIFAE